MKAGVFFAALALCAAAGGETFKAARPVWEAGRETERNLTIGFRVRFDGAKAAELRYSASSIARVWLNGEFLAYGPARGPHGIDRVDVIPLVGRTLAGENVLAFEVAGYNVDTFYLVNESAYLAAELLDSAGGVVAATGDGKSFEATVITERVQKVPRFSFQRPFCEVYSLKSDFAAWRKGAPRETLQLSIAEGSPAWIGRTAPYPDYSVSGAFAPIRRGRLEYREDATVHPGRSVTGEEDPMRGYAPDEIGVQPVVEIQKLCEADRRPLPAASRYRLDPKSYLLFDHGFCDTGFIGAKVVCRKPGRVYFHYDEVLVGDDDIDVQRMGWQCVNAVTYDFEEPGEYDVEAFEPGTFRYMKILSDGFEGDVSGLFVRAYKNARCGRARFESSDDTLDVIFEAARETFSQNAVDVLTDCPSRERAGWCCDSFFSSRTERWLTGGNPVERCFLENFAFASSYPGIPEGFLPMCYPAEAWLLPNWNLWLIIQLGEHFERTGDRSLVDAMEPKVKGAVEAFRKYRNSDGLLEKLPGWVFIEWSAANDLVQDVNYPSNMTWAKALDVAAELYGWKDCAQEAERVRRTVREQSWTGEWFCDNAVRQEDGSLKLSGECTETCQYYAFYFGTASKEEYPELWKRLVEDFGPKRKTTELHPQIHFANAFVGNYLRLELLSRDGRAAQILDQAKGYFAGMAARTGTLWEHDYITNSCDHGFASHVAVMLLRDVLGIAKIDRASKTVELKVDSAIPLEFCRGTVPLSETEDLEIAWKKAGGGTEIDIVHCPEGWSCLK
ncbi:MAG: hypothetical protein ILO34_01975 [Kiritimatiellae bacterium]|nr:hypothetical protein [Kiritimatiellia bacterium]